MMKGIKNIFMKKKFKDLVKVIEVITKDEYKDRLEKKVKYIENILDSTPKLVDVKDPKNGYTLLHYVMDKFNNYIIPDMEDYEEGKYDDEPEIIADTFTVVNESDIFREFEVVEKDGSIANQKNVENERSKLNLKVDDTFFQLVDLLLEPV